MESKDIEMKTDERVVAMIAEGVQIVSDKGVVLVSWAELMRGHHLIQDNQSFQLGVHVGSHIANLAAANDEL